MTAVTTTPRKHRLALFGLFFLPGLGFASWVGRTPAIRDSLDASTAQMGLILLGLSVGAVLGVLAAPLLVRRFGTRAVALAGVAGVLASMLSIGLGAASAAASAVVVGLLLFGLGMGASEVAMNIDGGVLERQSRMTVMAPLHGFFSLGSLCGALLSFGAVAVDLPVLWHLGGVAVLIAVVALSSVSHMPPGVGVVGIATPSAGAKKRGSVWSDPILLLIGFIALSMAMAEGTANEWLPLIMVDGRGFSSELGSVMFAIFAATMAVGRFSGTLLVARFGRSAVLVASLVAAAAGMSVVSLIDVHLFVFPAVILWALGISLGLPLALSAAAESGDDPSARVSAVATIGYLALLAGPPSLGLLGESFGLRSAILLPLVLVVTSVLCARVMRPRVVADGVAREAVHS